MNTYPVYFIDYYEEGNELPCRSTVKEHFYYRDEILIEAVLNLELSDANKAIVRYKEVERDSNECKDSTVIYVIMKM